MALLTGIQKNASASPFLLQTVCLHSNSEKNIGENEKLECKTLKKKKQLLGNHTMKLSNLQLTSRFWTQLHEHCCHCHLQYPVTVQVRLNITAKGQIWALLKFWVTSTYNAGDLDTKFICMLFVNICLNTTTRFRNWIQSLNTVTQWGEKQLQAVFPPTWLVRGQTIPKSHQPKATMRIILSAGLLEISVFSTRTA